MLFDTTFLIDTERAGDDLDEVIDDDDDVAIAAITIAELRVGVELARGRTHARRKEFLEDVLGTIPFLDYDAVVAMAHSTLLVAVREQGRPRGAHDLVIAATALASQRTIVSADQAAFADLPGLAVRPHR